MHSKEEIKAITAMIPNDLKIEFIEGMIRLELKERSRIKKAHRGPWVHNNTWKFSEFTVPAKHLGNAQAYFDSLPNKHQYYIYPD